MTLGRIPSDRKWQLKFNDTLSQSMNVPRISDEYYFIVNSEWWKDLAECDKTTALFFFLMLLYKCKWRLLNIFEAMNYKAA